MILECARLTRGSDCRANRFVVQKILDTLNAFICATVGNYLRIGDEERLEAREVLRHQARTASRGFKQPHVPGMAIWQVAVHVQRYF